MQAACVWILALDKDIIYIDGEEDLPCCPQKTQDWFNYFRYEGGGSLITRQG